MLVLVTVLIIWAGFALDVFSNTDVFPLVGIGFTLVGGWFVFAYANSH